MGAMKEVFMDRCLEWADNINDWYMDDATDVEVADVIWAEQKEINSKEYANTEERAEAQRYSFMTELNEETFTDTMPREGMAGAIVNKRVGMDFPCNGDDDEVKIEFAKRMKEWSKENS